jgi:hypothetical protein
MIALNSEPAIRDSRDSRENGFPGHRDFPDQASDLPVQRVSLAVQRGRRANRDSGAHRVEISRYTQNRLFRKLDHRGPRAERTEITEPNHVRHSVTSDRTLCALCG